MPVRPSSSPSFIPIFEQSLNPIAVIDAPGLDSPKLVNVDMNFWKSHFSFGDEHPVVFVCIAR